MKKLLLLIALFVCVDASADYFPSGCYVADYYRTDECWGEDVDYFNWNNYDRANPSGENEYYGSAVATLIMQETLYRQAFAVAKSENDKNKKLVKKLKSKCGSACRSVR
jgi:hypothetical protein